MAKGVDLNKLKDEIDSRKKERNSISSKLGESVGSDIAPRDAFLNGLLTSRETGKETASTKLIKLVENKVAAKHGELVRHEINETAVDTLPPRSGFREEKTTEVDMSPERDEQLFADLEKKRKQTLAEQMQGFINSPTSNRQSITPTQSPVLNEGVLVENVKKIVNNYLVENFGPVIEEAIKNTVIEMYAVERIKEVLQENKEMIKALVYETIRELQAKKKSQQQ